MLERLLTCIAIAWLAAACAGPGSPVALSEAETCARNGGIWRAVQGSCEPSASGGGGGY